MNKTYISIIILVLVAGFLFFVIKNKKSEAPMPLQNEIAEEVQPTATETSGEVGAEMEGIVTEEGVKEFTVSGTNFAFEPSTIKVKKGDKVKITFNNSQGFHDWVIDEFGAATKQTNAPTTEVIEFTADKTGSFEYYCSVGSHRAMGMKGTLIVE